MDDHIEQLTVPSVLRDLLVMPPLHLPGVLVVLISASDGNALLPELTTFLDADDKARWTGLASPDRRHRFMIGRSALRCLLTAFADRNVPETAWRFARSTKGKPYIKSPKTSIRSFNLSYADPFIALAVSTTVAVGVDIEIAHDIPEDERPFHLFSDDEQALLRATSADEVPTVFFRLWTLKEAIAKQTGQGFATEFNEINTLKLSVAEEVSALFGQNCAKRLLFHSRLNILDNPIHLAVSTAPID